jgi:uncharacterized membrane protein YcfT
MCDFRKNTYRLNDGGLGGKVMSKDSRELWADNAKGIGIILVVLGHSIGYTLYGAGGYGSMCMI